MKKAHPEFFPDTMTWEALGESAPSLKELQKKLPGIKLEGYYPSGYKAAREPPVAEVQRVVVPQYKAINRIPRKSKPEKVRPVRYVTKPVKREESQGLLRLVVRHDWTEVELKQLQMLISQNLRLRQIAREMGMSSGAIAGKASRMGWRIRAGDRSWAKARVVMELDSGSVGFPREDNPRVLINVD